MAKVQFRYREAGAGHSLVFAADPPMTLEAHDRLIAVFAPHRWVIALELPAMGFSVVSKDFGFSFRETNEEVAAFLEAVAGDQAILAFSRVSWLSAIDIAVRYPALCSRLALIQTGDVAAFALRKARRDPRRILAKPILGQLAMQRLAPKPMPDWYPLSVGQRRLIDGFCSCAAESFRRGALSSLASAYQRYMDPHLTLERPSQPVLSLGGKRTARIRQRTRTQSSGLRQTRGACRLSISATRRSWKRRSGRWRRSRRPPSLRPKPGRPLLRQRNRLCHWGRGGQRPQGRCAWVLCSRRAAL